MTIARTMVVMVMSSFGGTSLRKISWCSSFSSMRDPAPWSLYFMVSGFAAERPSHLFPAQAVERFRYEAEEGVCVE